MNKASIILLVSIMILSGLTIGGVQTVHAEWIEGHIIGDTTWTAADSPYVLSNDVYVDEGATLTIEPGTEVRFGGPFSIFVDGALNAMGTKNDMIMFTSNRLDPRAGDWGKICFRGTSSSASLSLKYCLIEYSKGGITIGTFGDEPIVESFKITHCELINNSQYGVFIHKASGGLSIKKNTFKYNGCGIANLVRLESISIADNEIVNNLHSGISILTCDVSTKISGNTVNLNGEYGICVHGSGGVVHDVTIFDNTVSSNRKTGIKVTSSCKEMHDIVISDNTVLSNEGDGISVATPEHPGRTHLYNIAILNNTISSNGRDGLDLITFKDGKESSVHDITISGNSMSKNDHGIYLRTGYDRAVCLYDVVISDNVISENNADGIYIRGDHYSNVDFDVAISDNVIIFNYIGIRCRASAKEYITGNSIGYNTKYGIRFEPTHQYGGTIQFNDIYNNTEGVDAWGETKLDAENNYWGDPTGPYHESLNPTGTGDTVDGGVIDFIPFLTSPVNPIVENPVPDVAVAVDTTNVEEGDSNQMYTDPAIEDDSTLPTPNPTIDKHVTSEETKNTIPGFKAISVIIVVFVLAYLWKQGRGGSNE